MHRISFIWVKDIPKYRRSYASLFLPRTKNHLSQESVNGDEEEGRKSLENNTFHAGSVRDWFVLRTTPQPCLDPPKSKLHDSQKRRNETGKRIWKKSLLNDVRVQL